MRDKNRIKELMKKLKQCWDFTPDTTFYELLFALYHDTPENWTDFYKEDDFWLINMEDYKMVHIADNLFFGINKKQEKILNNMQKLWEKHYDLRFPQIVNLIYTIAQNETSNEKIAMALEKEVGEIYAN